MEEGTEEEAAVWGGPVRGGVSYGTSCRSGRRRGGGGLTARM